MCCLPSAVVVAAECEHRHGLLHGDSGARGDVDVVENFDIAGVAAGTSSLSYVG